MSRYATILLMVVMVHLAGCGFVPELDDVLPDKRNDYKKSESLPNLEIPPDLTAEAINDSMSIPEEERANLSSYRKQAEAAPAAAAVPAAPDEQWVSVRGARSDIWPRLRSFFTGKGYPLELDDADLGVLETGWSEPFAAGGGTERNKFKIFTEPGGSDDVTVLFVSSERQQQAGEDWLDAGNSSGAEKQLAGELNVFFNSAAAGGGQPPAPATASASPVSRAAARSLASIENTEDGRKFLALPDEFTVAWRYTESALRRGGLYIEGSDPSSGIYRIAYVDDTGADGGKEKGWFSKLAFWKDDDAQGRNFQVSLTGVGNRTELIVLNEEGDWDSGEEAGRILSIISSQYGAE